MKEIIENLALIHLNNFGVSHNIEIYDTHLVKNGRGFAYSLCNKSGHAIVTVRFSKSSVPSYYIHK